MERTVRQNTFRINWSRACPFLRKNRSIIPAALLVRVVCLVALLPTTAFALSTTETLVQTLTSTWDTRMTNAKYMRKNAVAVAWPNYTGYPTVMCTYYETDTTGAYAGQQKKAKVVLLDIPTNMIARWAVNALIDVTGQATQAQGNQIMQTVLYASGGQFPIAGMVYEDMEGSGQYTLYCFRDGLTCGIGGGFPNNTKRPLTDAEINQALYSGPTSAKSYARIISSTREMYQNNGGNRNVDGLNFPPVIRDVYKRAMDTGRNEAFEGWVRANFSPNQNPPQGSFPYIDTFPSSGRQLNSWLDHYTFHTVKPFGLASPGGDGYVMVVMDPSGGVDTSSLGSAASTNYRVEADIYCEYRPALASDGFERIGIFARDSGGVFDWSVSGVKGNNYLISWDSDDGRLRCGKCVDSVVTDLLPTPTYLKSSAWRRMAIEVIGDQITYLLDNQVKLKITDATFPAGKFGIGYREAFTTNANMRGTRADNFHTQMAPLSAVGEWSLY